MRGQLTILLTLCLCSISMAQSPTRDTLEIPAAIRHADSIRYWFDEEGSPLHISTTGGQIEIDAAHLGYGTHTLHCQAIDSAGTPYGIFNQRFERTFDIGDSIGQWCYWFDEDTTMHCRPIGDGRFLIDADFLCYGMHTLHCQIVDENNLRYPTYSIRFYKELDIQNNSDMLCYWFDEDTTIQTISLGDGNYQIDANHLNYGTHTLHFQIVDENGSRYPVYSTQFTSKANFVANDSANTIVYWYDDDTTFTTIPLGNGLRELDVPPLLPGSHVLHASVMHENGCLTPILSTMFYKFDDEVTVDSVIYWVDDTANTHRTVAFNRNLILDMDSLECGPHTLYMQCINSNGWRPLNIATSEFYWMGEGCCTQPQYVSADHIGYESARVHWTYGHADSFYVAISTSPFLPDTAQYITVTDTQHVFSGLQDYTQYYYAVRTACDTAPDAWVQGTFQTISQLYHRIYVSTEGTTGNNGTSWDDAFGSIQPALAKADSIRIHYGFTPDIWVAEGSYDTTSILSLVEGCHLYGGFVGNEAEDYNISSRDINRHKTYIGGLNQQRTFTMATSAVIDGVYLCSTIYLREYATLRNSYIQNVNTSGTLITLVRASAENCLIAQNNASTGVVMMYDGATLSHCNIVNNSTSRTAVYGDLRSSSTASSIQNSIIWGNTCHPQISGIVTAKYSAIQDYTGDSTVITLSPDNTGIDSTANYCHFACYAGGDYHLTASSDLIDAARDTEASADIEGTPYNYNGHADIGCYEYSGQCWNLPAPGTTIDSININFTELHISFPNKALFLIAYDTVPFLPDMATNIVTTTDTIYRLTGLDYRNTYYYAVKADCYSDEWSPLDNFTTHTVLHDTLYAVICQGDTFAFRGASYHAPGNYSDTIAVGDILDSIYTLALTVNPTYATIERQRSCNDYSWHEHLYSNSGDYIDSLHTINGCDSVVTLHLTIHESDTHRLDVTACESYEWRGVTFTADTITPMVTDHNRYGCDSLVSLNLIIHHDNHADTTYYVTSCGKYEWNGHDYLSSGTYTHNYTLGESVCVNTDTLHLTIKPNSATTETYSNCNEFLWHDSLYTASTSTATYTTTNAVDCDSVVTLHLTIHRSDTNNISVHACDSYVWHDVTFTEDTVTPFLTEQNRYGCDSLVALHLRVGHTNTGTETVSACRSYRWHGTTYTESTDTPTFVERSASGCDSVVTLNLTINHSSHPDIVLYDTACGRYIWNGRTYNNSGVYTYTHNYDDSPCPGIDTLHLTIHPEYNSRQVATIFDGDSYIFYGQEYSRAGVYVDTMYSVYGCDSLHTLDLRLWQVPAYITRASICQGMPYSDGRFNIPAETTADTVGLLTFRDTLRSVQGFDSVVYGLNLTVKSINLPAVTGLTPSMGSVITEGDIVLRWNAVEGAERYKVYLGKADRNMPTTPYTTTSQTSVKVPYYDNESTYQWMVEAISTCDTVASATQIFGIDKVPQLSMRPQAIEFGEVDYNTSRTNSIFVSGIDLTDSIRMTLHGSDSALFALSSNVLGRYGASVQVTFTPTVLQSDFKAYLVAQSRTCTDTVEFHGKLTDYYRFTVSVPDSILPPNTPVPISGTLHAATGVALPNQQVEVYVMVMGQRFAIPATTDSLGHFTATYTPQMSESGYYQIGACMAGANKNRSYTEFNIPGVSLSSTNLIKWDVQQGDTISGTISIHNRCNIPLDHLTVTAQNLPNGLSVNFDRMALGRLQTGDIHFTLVGNELSIGNNYEAILFDITCDQGNVGQFNAYYYCMERLAELQVEPKRIDLTAVANVQQTIDVAVYNNTNHDALGVTVSLPSGVSYLSVMRDADSITIPAHDSIFVPILVNFTDEPISQYSGTIVVGATNSDDVVLPYTITLCSEAKGQLRVSVANEFTYYNNGPRVKDASVTVIGYYSLDTMAHGITDSTGILQWDSIPEGYYNLYVSAPDNSSYSAVIKVTAGQLLSQNVNLEYIAVKYSYVVYPTEIEDHYEVALNVEYKTNVPKPVIIFQIPDLIDVPLDGSDYLFNIVATNQGLVDAYDAELTVPNSDIYEFTPWIDRIDTIKALSSVTIPCLVKNKAIYDTVNKLRSMPNVVVDTEYTINTRVMSSIIRVDTLIIDSSITQTSAGQIVRYDTIRSIPVIVHDTTYDSILRSVTFYENGDIAGNLPMYANSQNRSNQLPNYDTVDGVIYRIEYAKPGDQSPCSDFPFMMVAKYKCDNEGKWVSAGYNSKTRQCHVDEADTSTRDTSTHYRFTLNTSNYNPLFYPTYRNNDRRQKCTPSNESSEPESNLVESECVPCWKSYVREIGRWAAGEVINTVVDHKIEQLQNQIRIDTYKNIDYYSRIHDGLSNYYKSLIGIVFIGSPSGPLLVAEDLRTRALMGMLLVDMACAQDVASATAEIGSLDNEGYILPTYQLTTDIIEALQLLTEETYEGYEAYHPGRGWSTGLGLAGDAIGLIPTGAVGKVASAVLGLGSAIMGAYADCHMNQEIPYRRIPIDTINRTNHPAENLQRVMNAPNNATTTTHLSGADSLLMAAKNYFDTLLALRMEFAGGHYDYYANHLEMIDTIMEYYLMTDTARYQEVANILGEDISLIDSTDVAYAVEKWNRTKLYWDNDWIMPKMVPDSLSKDFYYVSIGTLTSLVNTEKLAAEYGFESVIDLLANSADYWSKSPIKKSECATVKLQFNQEIAMTREAFQGVLTIVNNNDTAAVTNIETNFTVHDSLYRDCSDRFAISVTNLSNIANSSIAPGATGEVTVNYIPSLDAAPTEPMDYYFDGTFSFTDPRTGMTVTNQLSPTKLTVHPSPNLMLDYFVQRTIIADDPLTSPKVERSVPATLGLRINNIGFGDAHNVRVSSLSPQIVENRLGLAIDFRMLNSLSNGTETSLPLSDIYMGDISNHAARVIEYGLQSSLLGYFNPLNVDVIHDNAAGNKNMSLVSARAHRLIKTVREYGDNADIIHDFLVDDIEDPLYTPDSIYFSDGRASAVRSVDSSAFDHYVVPEDTVVEVTLYPNTTGWQYTNMSDPGDDRYEVVRCVRDDSTEIPLDNIWQTFVELYDGSDPIYTNKLHLVDTLSSVRTTRYNVTFRLRAESLIVDTIENIPTSLITTPLDHFVVRFSQPIMDSTFSYKDMSLKCNNGPQLMDSAIDITKLNDMTFSVDISGKTQTSGLYVLNIFADSIMDANGYYGLEGKQAMWTQSVCESYYQTIVATACDSYQWNNQTLTATGLYSDTIALPNGCDSIYILDLTIHNADSTVETLTICDSIIWHDVTYTESTNEPSFATQNIFGCDSIVMLNLTVNNSSFATETLSACDSITWHDVTYTESTNVPTFATQNIFGCDSIVTLNLTVNNSSFATEMLTACDSIIWHDVTYTESTNEPSFATQNIFGCDSIVTLNLTVHASSTPTEYEYTGCDSIVWNRYVFYETSDTNIVYANADGCDSTVVLHLTVNFASQNLITDTAVTSYMWNGIQYTHSGEYTYVSQTENGCDSIVTLFLTITNDDAQTELDQIVIYPNPTNGIITIGSNDVICVEVYSTNGSRIETYIETNQFDISHLPTGTYMIRIATTQGSTIRRVIKR